MSKRPKISWNNLIHSYRIFRFIKPYRWFFIFGMLFLVMGSGLFMIFPAAAGEMANTAVGKGSWGINLSQFGLVFLVILIVQGILSYYRTTFFAKVSEMGMADLRKALYQKLITQDIAYFETYRVGELTSRMTADVEQLQAAFSITLAEFVRQLVVLLGGILIIAWMTPKLALTMLMTFPIIVIASLLFGRYIRRLSKDRQDKLAETNIIVEESFQSFQNVKSFTNEAYEVNRFGNSLKSMVDISMKYAKMRGVFFIFIITILFGGLFYILWKGALLVEQGQMQIGDLISFIIYTGIIGGAIAGLGNLYTALAGSIGATERIQDILDRPQELELNDSSDSFKRFDGNLQFDKISFEYPGRPEIQVLQEISFSVEKGKRIAFVGSSGAGKSTLVQLLMRFYNPSSGTIRIDGKEVTQFDLHNYRKNIAIVPQEIILFGGSIRENIKYGNPNATDQEIEEAAKKSNSYEFIQSFPQKFETLVGERGIKLSGGQRQRIAIARAILKNPSILVLDEATSSLDAESEKLVQEALDELMRQRTSLIIAHRLSTIRDADKIYVLKKGKIVESGSHEELIQIQNGTYKALVELQLDPIDA